MLYPRAYAEAQQGADRWRLRAECLLRGEPEVDVLLRFMQISNACHPERERGTWEGGRGEEDALSPHPPAQAPRYARGDRDREVPLPGTFAFDPLEIWSDVRTTALSPTLWKITVDVENRTPFDGDAEDRDAALPRSLASAHLVLTARSGSFVSLLDPPPELAEAAAACRSEGVHPVLAGERSMLASPIILDDQPRIAPESRGDLFDSTEIDEILSLRIMTLTDEEKAEACATDDRARRIIERTDALTAEELLAMHGVIRGLRVGDRVRLRPRRMADIMDIALAGKTATIASIETDFDDRIHLAVLVDDDPGRDLGELQQPGHRFFFSPEEVEPL